MTNRVCAQDFFAIQLEDEPKHTVGGRMLRTWRTINIIYVCHYHDSPKVNYANNLALTRNHYKKTNAYP